MPPTTVPELFFGSAIFRVDDGLSEEIEPLNLACPAADALSCSLLARVAPSCHSATLASDEDVALATDSAKNLSG